LMIFQTLTYLFEVNNETNISNHRPRFTNGN
jgi:hypothetical protein